MERWIDGKETDKWLQDVEGERADDPWTIFPRAVTDWNKSTYTLSSSLFMSSDQGTRWSSVSGTEPQTTDPHGAPGGVQQAKG